MPLPVCLGLILLAAGAPSGAVIVRGDSDCPSPSAVSEALAGLLSPPEAGDAPDVVELRRHDGALEVRLTEAGGPLIAARRLAAGQPCRERAQTVAVLVAAWETRLRAGEQAVLPRIPVPAPARGPGPPDARTLPPPRAFGAAPAQRDIAARPSPSSGAVTPATSSSDATQ